jgi:hypothetical protein
MTQKIIVSIGLLLSVSVANAQDLTSKKGEPYLPEAGDYMIGIDANPFLNYIGNFFGKGGTTTTSTSTSTTSTAYSNSAPTFNFMNGKTSMITGKYFKDAKTAYRVGVRIGIDSKTTINTLADANKTGTLTTFPNLPAMKEDKYKHNMTNIGLTIGIEKRRGKTRLQGFYGADFMLWGSSSKDKYTYGQTIDGTTAGLTAVDTTKAAQNTTDFGSNISTISGSNATSGRITLKKTGNGVGFGVRAFIGAEYFILPKISIGGEFGWGIGYMTGGKTRTTVESIGVESSSSTPTNKTIEVTAKNGGHFIMDTDLNSTSSGSLLAPSASLRLNLHF